MKHPVVFGSYVLSRDPVRAIQLTLHHHGFPDLRVFPISDELFSLGGRGTIGSASVIVAKPSPKKHRRCLRDDCSSNDAEDPPHLTEDGFDAVDPDE
jgi:hypothetical protein